jgi:hypothetical protein
MEILNSDDDCVEEEVVNAPRTEKKKGGRGAKK